MAAQLGLIGFPVAHSYSADYFKQKYDCTYQLFPLEKLNEFPQLLLNNPGLNGLNVTIPYKQSIIPYLDELDATAKAINAVNTILIQRKGEKLLLKGYNTDVIGFRKALLAFLPKAWKSKVLVLGNGGATRAVCYVLEQLQLNYTIVSRSPGKDQLSYNTLDAKHMVNHQLIINTTPLGMSPKVATAPDLPYAFLTDQHLLFDLVYNPEKTLFMEKGEAAGARVYNGLTMLYAQADAAWELWKAD